MVDPKIKELLGLSIDKKRKELVFYQIATGGKRLRLVLTIASCLVCKGKMEDAFYAV